MASLRTLFDQYQILGVAIRWYLTSSTVAPAGIPACTFATSIDRDEGAPPLSYDDLLQRANCKTKILSGAGGMTQMVKHYQKPRVLNMIYMGPTSTAYSLGRKSLIDIMNPGVPHYGLIWALQADGTAMPDFQLNIQRTYYLKFKCVR